MFASFRLIPSPLFADQPPFLQLPEEQKLLLLKGNLAVIPANRLQTNFSLSSGLMFFFFLLTQT